MHEDEHRGDGVEQSNGAGHPDLSERADELLRRASALREHCEQLGERLDALVRSIPGTFSPRPPESSEGIRLVATNLALNGATREEVDARLREAFGVQDNDVLIDQVFAAIERPAE